MNIKHTKGKLKIDKTFYYYHIDIIAEDTSNICFTTSGHREIDKANAKHLVKCWNMHNELLETTLIAGKIIIELYDEDIAEIDKNVVLKIKEVLKKATE